MRSIHRVTTAVVLTVILAMPAGAAGRLPSRSKGLVYSFKRFIVRVVSRISPPGGVTEPEPEEPAPTTTPTGVTATP